MTGWKHELGYETAQQKLTAVCETHIDVLAAKNVKLYGTSFKGGVDNNALKESSSLLLDLVNLDGRGACFRQSDLRPDVTAAFKKKDKYAAFGYSGC